MFLMRQKEKRDTNCFGSDDMYDFYISGADVD